MVIDEMSLISRQILDLIDKSFPSLFESPEPFAGKSIVFIGDFRLTSTVVTNDLGTQIVIPTIINSKVWRHDKTYFLKENSLKSDDQDFCTFFLSVGDGSVNTSKS